MEADQELQQHITSQMPKEANSPDTSGVNHQSTRPQFKKYIWWLKITLYAFFVLAAGAAATLLGQLYYDKGGKSKWMATFVQTAGFPVLIPLFFMTKNEIHSADTSNQTKKPSLLVLASLYTFLGVFLAAVCMLYSIGLLYLPVSTYSLICASQLAFNAFFSYFLNDQKFTPLIVNSLVLLTVSSTLLVFQNDSDKSKQTSKGKYAIGFLCTLGASAGYSLMLAVTQFSFQRILRRKTFRVVLDMIIYQSVVATLVILVGLFASKEWRTLNREMEEYQLGNASYVLTLVWIAILWQVYSIGAVGLIFEVSSLFSNVISTLSLPVIPVLAVVFFHDKMSGVKAVSMFLAIWGFASYIYQHYLDDLESEDKKDNVVSELPIIERKHSR